MSDETTFKGTLANTLNDKLSRETPYTIDQTMELFTVLVKAKRRRFGTDEPYSYKKRAINPGEFLFKEAKVGKRSDLIFVFEPVDAQEYTAVEIREKDLFKHIPAIEQNLCQALVDAAPSTVTIYGQYSNPGAAFADCVRQFRKHVEALENNEQRKAEERAKKEILEARALNPHWGMF